jgi:transcriptional regulator with XRE-family HTH domain
VATTLAKAIRRSGLTKSECAEASGISRSQLYMYESGKLRPELKNATRIAKVLGVEVGEVAEFRPGLEEAEARRVAELMEEVREQVLGEGREVHIAIGDLPNWLRDELARYARQNPDRVRHLTLDLTLEEMQALAARSKGATASSNGRPS